MKKERRINIELPNKNNVLEYKAFTSKEFVELIDYDADFIGWWLEATDKEACQKTMDWMWEHHGTHSFDEIVDHFFELTDKNMLIEHSEIVGWI